MSNSNHTTYVTTYVTTYTYLYISMQIIKYKYINVTTFAHLSLHLPIAPAKTQVPLMSLLRLTKVTSGASKAWTPEFYFTKPMEFVYFMYNFESFFVFIFLCFFLKQRKPLRFDAISCFHLAHFMISICKKISSKENQTTET